MCSGGGGTNTVTSTQRFEPPSWLTSTPNGNLWANYVNTGINRANQGYVPNPNPQTAGLNNIQVAGLNQVADVATSGTPIGNAGQAQTMGTLSGDYLGAGPQANVTPGTNPYAGANPYLDANINATADNMIRGHQQGSAAQLDALAARQGGFGSSGWQQMQAQGDQGLAQNIGNMAGQMRMQDYGMQQQLAEAGLGRGMQSQMFNAGQNMNAWNQERGRQMDAAGLSRGMYADDLNAGRALTGVGDALHSYQQQTYDDLNNSWQQQQDYPWQQLQRIGSLLSQASGTNGSSQLTQSGGGGGGPGWLSGLLGAGSLGLAASRYF